MRPYIVCHMLSSVDGRIGTENWVPFKRIAAYEETGITEQADAWLCGRITMQQNYAIRWSVLAAEPAGDRSDQHAATVAHTCAIAIDPKGKLGRASADLDGDHLITVLTQQVPQAYFTYLRERNITYIFGEDTSIDLTLIATKLHQLFGIRKIKLEGGGGINGSFHGAGLIGYSVLFFPIADGSDSATFLGTTAADPSQIPFTRLELTKVEQLPDDVIWVNYLVVK